MKKETTLSQRMKEYELETKLVPRSPIIVRLDGNSFHRVCKNIKRPYDDEFMKMMQYIVSNLGATTDGTTIIYTQSDEITMVVLPYRRYTSVPIYKLRIQKITSLLASKATSIIQGNSCIIFFFP